jgi:hypothetical protein
VNGSSPSLAQAPLRFSYSEAGDLEISRPEEAVAGAALAASIPADSPVGLATLGAMPRDGLTDAVLGAPMTVRIDTPLALASIDAAASGINAAVDASALTALAPVTAPVVAALPALGVGAGVAGVTVNAGLTNGNVAAGLGVDPTATLALAPSAVAPVLPPAILEIPVVTPVLTALLPPQTPTLAPTTLVADVANLPGAVAGLGSLLGRR